MFDRRVKCCEGEQIEGITVESFEATSFMIQFFKADQIESSVVQLKIHKAQYLCRCVVE